MDDFRFYVPHTHLIFSKERWDVAVSSKILPANNFSISAVEWFPGGGFISSVVDYQQWSNDRLIAGGEAIAREHWGL